MTKTTNYQLNQWAKSDRILMDDFNADNQKLDAALAGLPKIAVGTYTGTGTYGYGKGVTITFPFVPKLVLITKENGETQGHRAILLHGCTSATTNGYISYSIGGVAWNDSEKSVSFYGAGGANSNAANAGMNAANAKYLWFAIG